MDNEVYFAFLVHSGTLCINKTNLRESQSFRDHFLPNEYMMEKG